MLYSEADLVRFKPLIEYNISLLQKENLSLNLFECPCGNIAKCRAEAAERSTAPYFGWIDSDDILISGAYTKLSQAIEASAKPFAWMNESMVVVNEHQVEVFNEVRKVPHHIHLIHKDLLDFSYLKYGVDRLRPDSWLSTKMSDGVHVDEVGYIWRRRKDGLSVANFS